MCKNINELNSLIDRLNEISDLFDESELDARQKAVLKAARPKQRAKAGRKQTNVTRQDIERLKAGGSSMAEVAKQLGISRATAYNILSK